jgi:hypothetical protein
VLSDKQWVEVDTAIPVRYIKYSFGANSADYEGVGSAIMKLHAEGPFDEGDDPPHSCWIGLNDQAQEGRFVWSDASSVDFYNFNPAEPNDCCGNGINFDGGEDCVNLDIGARAGKWNDLKCSSGESAQGGNGLLFPVCQTTTYHPKEQYQYIGCFVDGDGGSGGDDGGTGVRDVNGITQQINGNTFDDGSQGLPYFDMGMTASAEKCAELCAGFKFFALQFYSQCFCDNANLGKTPAPDSECDTPCNDGTDSDGTVDHYGTQLHSADKMCGGTWRNSVYSTSTTYWESAGYDDRAWEAAADLGANGAAPWYHRENIGGHAHWIWSADGYDHDHVFCRYVQPNKETNCPAAEAMYLEDHPDVHAQGFPAWAHYQNVGEEQGFYWHSDLCNYCHPGDDSGEVGSMAGTQFGQQGDGGNSYGSYGTPYSYEEGLTCTNKCAGMHDAAGGVRGINDGTGHNHASVEYVGAIATHNHGGHYGQGFADFQNPTGDSITFHLYSCNAGMHEMSIVYALASDDPPRPLTVTVNGMPIEAPDRNSCPSCRVAVENGQVEFPATGAWTEWGKVYVPVLLKSGQNDIVMSVVQNSGPNIDSIEVREKQIRGSGGSLEPRGPLPMRLHTMYMEYSVLHIYGTQNSWNWSILNRTF